MSQAKVDRYKKEKANRAKILKKEKAERLAAKIAGLVICAALLGWVGYSGYGMYTDAHPAPNTPITTDAIDTYISGLSS